MSRIWLLLTTIGVAGAFGALSAGVPMLTAPFAALALVGVGSARTARRIVPDGAWAPLIDGSPTPVPIARPPSSRRVARALGRVEARELALHPWFGAGIGLCAFMVIAFGLAGNADGTWEDELQGLTFLAHPVAGMAVVAGHAATSRSQRTGTSELFETCPTAPPTRVLGSLGSMWVPPAVLAVFFAAYVTSTAISNPDLTAPTGPVILHMASGLILGAGGVALGAALGRWVRFALAPILAIVVVGLVSVRLAAGTGSGFESEMVLSTFPPLGDQDEMVLLTAGQMSWHLLWLLGLTVATAGVAVVRPLRTWSRPTAAAIPARAAGT